MSSPSTTSIDEILDANAVGLVHFERFLPLVARVPGCEGFPHYEQVCARYDEQRGMDLAALGQDSDAIEELSAVLRDQLDEQIRLRRVLQMRWHGEAGDAVQTYLSAEHSAANELVTSIENCHQAMSAAAVVLRDAVTDKAELFGGLDVDTVDGRTVDEIDAILLASGVECVPFDRESVFPRLASAFEELAQRVGSADVSDELAVEVGERCRRWIHEQFVPTMKTTCDAVLSACSATDTAVRDSLACLVEELGGVHDPSFGDLDERRWAIAPGAAAEPWTAADGPSETLPAAIPPAAASESAAPAGIGAPDVAAPVAGAPMVAAGTASSYPATTDATPKVESGDSLNALVDRLVTEIVDRVDDALNDAISDDSSAEDRSAEDRSAEDRSAGHVGAPSAAEPVDGSVMQDGPPVAPTESVPSSPPEQVFAADPLTRGATDERGHLEAELDGHRARIALERDGGVSLRLDTPGLGVRSFAVRIGPLGLPEIVETPCDVDEVGPNQSPIPAATPPSESVPPISPAPDNSAATDPAPTDSAPAEPAPAESVASQEPVAPVPAEAQPQCLPEAPAQEPTFRRDEEKDVADDPPSAAQHPVAADVQSPPAESLGSSTGAGVSEAGTL